MGEWKTKRLGEIAELIMGQSPDGKFYNSEGNGMPFLQGCSEFGKQHPETTVFSSVVKKIAPENSILFSVRAPVGKTNFADKEYCIGRGIAAIKGREVDTNYLNFSIFFQNINGGFTSQGSTFDSINFAELSKLKILLPDEKLEQSTIATILTTIDQAIEKTERLIAKYEHIKTGLMQDLLTRGIDEQGRIRREETHEFKDSPLGRIPVEWEVGTIGKNCKIQNSFRKPLSAEVRENMKGKYPYYGPTGVLDYINEYRVDGKYVLIGEDGDHFLKFASQEMTLLVEGKFNVNNHAHILEGKEDCTTEWIHCYFSHRDITYHLTRQGAGRFKLNKAALSNLPIVIPSIKEQDRVIEMINSIRANLTKEKTILNGFNKQKIGLMQDLLTGKVRVDGFINSLTSLHES